MTVSDLLKTDGAKPNSAEVSAKIRALVEAMSHVQAMANDLLTTHGASLDPDDRRDIEAMGGKPDGAMAKARGRLSRSISKRGGGSGDAFRDAYGRLGELRKRQGQLIGGAREAFPTERRDLRLQISALEIAIQEAGGAI